MAGGRYRRGRRKEPWPGAPSRTANRCTRTAHSETRHQPVRVTSDPSKEGESTRFSRTLIEAPPRDKKGKWSFNGPVLAVPQEGPLPHASAVGDAVTSSGCSHAEAWTCVQASQPLAKLGAVDALDPSQSQSPQGTDGDTCPWCPLTPCGAWHMELGAPSWCL